MSIKIILVITDTRKKSLAFASDTLKAFALEEALNRAARGGIYGAHVVRRASGAYLHTNQKISKQDEFDQLSITSRALLAFMDGTRHANSTPILSRYVELYIASLEEGQPFIEPVNQPKVLKAAVKAKFVPHRLLIFEAAEKFDIDPYLLGAVLIDEIARIEPFKDMVAELAARIVGYDASVGLAQVKIDTAHDLIKKGIYHPNLSDKKLPYKRLTNAGRAHLYTYLILPEHNIFFAAAFIRFVIDLWSEHIDLLRHLDIIATRYHKGYGDPEQKEDRKSDKRGKQISGEFYRLSKLWLQKK